MPAPASTPALAYAFLALSDDGEPSPRRTPARVATAALAATVLAFAAPLGWIARPHSKAPASPAALSARLFGADED